MPPSSPFSPLSNLDLLRVCDPTAYKERGMLCTGDCLRVVDATLTLLYSSLSLIHRERQHSFLLPFTMLECSFVPFLTDLSQSQPWALPGLRTSAADCGCSADGAQQRNTWATPAGPGAVWSLPTVRRQHCSPSTPRAPQAVRGMASLTVSCLGPAAEMTVVSGEKGSLPVVQEGSSAFTSICSFPLMPAASCCFFAVRYGPGGFSAVPAEELCLQAALAFSTIILFPRMPSSACVGMTHLALVIGKSLSLMKRHQTKSFPASFQSLPG